MAELSLVVDELTGVLLVEKNSCLNGRIQTQLTKYLGKEQEMGCAHPIEYLQPPLALIEDRTESVCVRIAGYYHNSLCEGPGRRSSVLFQYCPLEMQRLYLQSDVGEVLYNP